MSKTKAFLLSVCIALAVFLFSAAVHVVIQLGIAEECVVLCTIYFLIVSTWFWSRK